MPDIKPKSKATNARGGSRAGAGRPAGSSNRATLEQKARLSDLAKSYAADAMSTLAWVAKRGKSETARVAAACAILDRAFGRPGLLVEVAADQEGSLSRALNEIIARGSKMPLRKDDPPDA
jgi:hypothetical protein